MPRKQSGLQQMGYMLIEFFSKNMVVYLMLAVSVIGILGRALAGRRCRKLSHQAEDLVLAKDRELKQLRVHFESAYRLNHGEVRARSMVKHHLSGYHMMGMSIGRLEYADRTAALVCVLLAVSGFGVLFTHEQSIYACARVFFWGMGLAAADILLGMLMGFHSIAALCDSLTDYLENSLAARLSMEQEQRAASPARSSMRDDLFMKKEEPEETGLELYQEPASQIAATIEKEPQRAGAHEPAGRRLSDRDEQLIADVLKEYLGGKYS